MNLNKVTHNETERYLVEVSQSISTTINVKCKSIFRTLYSIEILILRLMIVKKKSIDTYQKLKLFEFDWLGIIDSNGNFVSALKDTGNVKGQDFYRKVLQGKKPLLLLNHNLVHMEFYILYHYTMAIKLLELLLLEYY